jgi:hypothetical protein
VAFYAVDVRDRVIQRVTRQHNGSDNAGWFLIEAGSAKLDGGAYDVESFDTGHMFN